MTPFDLLIDTDEREALASRITGVVVGIVTNNQDPDKLGRVKVKFPWLSSDDESYWARIAAPMAGPSRGFYFLPEVNDEVLVVFEYGDLRFPYVLGALWNGKDKPPIVKDEDLKGNHVRLMKSRSGHVIRLTDEDGKEKLEIEDKSGKNKLVIDTAANTISLVTDKDIKLSAAQGQITLSAQTIVLDAQSKIEVKSSGSAVVEAQGTQGSLDLKASGCTNIKRAEVNIN
jgi:uncharacterized protein involved in type VI secretion and phage assembly